ncbi:MAG: EVE domain-containing protein [Xanthomonadales bacterium]|jgi:predicted RNA-binding protein with PUA-like domain|nr:EVE domain-containing protein [Xanthomonadales bacterium]
MAYWLMKSEPDVFGIDDLKRNQVEPWDGVRNYQARNFMRDHMQVGDGVLFYHSNTKPPGIAGIAEVASKPYDDPTQFDPEAKYFDPKSSLDKPRWQLVDIKYIRHLQRYLSLDELKQHTDVLTDFPLLRKGNRLSVMPVEAEHWQYILNLEQA